MYLTLNKFWQDIGNSWFFKLSLMYFMAEIYVEFHFKAIFSKKNIFHTSNSFKHENLMYSPVKKW